MQSVSEPDWEDREKSSLPVERVGISPERESIESACEEWRPGGEKTIFEE